MMGSAGICQQTGMRVGNISLKLGNWGESFYANGSVYFDEDVECQAAHDVPQSAKKSPKIALPAPKERNSTSHSSAQNAPKLPLSRGVISSNGVVSQITSIAFLPPLLPEPDIFGTESLRGMAVRCRPSRSVRRRGRAGMGKSGRAENYER